MKHIPWQLFTVYSVVDRQSIGWGNCYSHWVSSGQFSLSCGDPGLDTQRFPSWLIVAAWPIPEFACGLHSDAITYISFATWKPQTCAATALQPARRLRLGASRVVRSRLDSTESLNGNKRQCVRVQQSMPRWKREFAWWSLSTDVYLLCIAQQPK